MKNKSRPRIVEKGFVGAMLLQGQRHLLGLVYKRRKGQQTYAELTVGGCMVELSPKICIWLADGLHAIATRKAGES